MHGAATPILDRASVRGRRPVVDVQRAAGLSGSGFAVARHAGSALPTSGSKVGAVGRLVEAGLGPPVRGDTRDLRRRRPSSTVHDDRGAAAPCWRRWVARSGRRASATCSAPGARNGDRSPTWRGWKIKGASGACAARSARVAQSVAGWREATRAAVDYCRASC